MSRSPPLPCVAFDEAGNTGANLLDATQPVFVLASVLLTEEVAALASLERELKFATLRRSASGRRAVLDILNHNALRSEHCVVSGIHKKFMAVMKIVDLLFEPLAYAGGLDLYERGANLAMANLLYTTLPTFVGEALCETLVRDFVAMAREPDRRNVDQFFEAVRNAYEAASPDNLKHELGALMASRAVVEGAPEAFNANAMDPAFPSFVMHASEWTGRLDTPFDIVHDSSKLIEGEQLILEAMMSVSDTPRLMGYDRRKMHFPLRATGITLRDSRSEPSIQVADIVASSCAYMMRSQLLSDGDPFVGELLGTRLFQGTWLPVWPSPEVTPQGLGTEEPAPESDPHNHVGNYVSARLGGIPPVGQRRKAKKDTK
ncbi:MAG TPA: DUF3800 domain-containing protein [Polyangiaceae bacterium]